VPLEIIDSAKRKRTEYVKTVRKDEQQLSFEERRANDAYIPNNSATVETLWHDIYIDRESTKNSCNVRSNQTEPCMNTTTCKNDPVQLSVTKDIVESPCVSERSEAGLRTSSQGKFTIVHIVYLP
jgi:hypothetical protein